MGAFWAAYGSTAAFAMINAFFALSTYAVLQTGLLSFATVTFAAVGGFLSTQMVLAGWPLPAAFAAAAGAGGMASALAALVLLRLRSHWMALASLALVLITRIVVLNSPTLTGGANGLSVPVDLSIAWPAGMLAFSMVAFWALDRSWYGIAARAVREDPAVASSMGIRPRQIQAIAFVISGVTGGLGGALLALMLQYVSPDTFFINIAFAMIAAVVLGGSYHWLGPVIGAAAFTVLPVVTAAVLPDVQDIAKGVVLLLVMLFLPRGMVDPRAIRLRAARMRAGRTAQ